MSVSTCLQKLPYFSAAEQAAIRKGGLDYIKAQMDAAILERNRLREQAKGDVQVFADGRWQEARASMTDTERASFRETERAYGGHEAYERAKAAGKTKLNYRQWVQVRTPEFKKWFGDHELAALGKTMRQARGSDQVKAVREELIGKPFTNAETGLAATVSGESFRKMLSASAVTRSVSPQAHMQALGNIDTLFRLATRTETRKGKKENDADSISAIHHFAVPMPFDGETLEVRIMAKELAQEDQGNRLYLVEALEIETPASLKGEPSSHNADRSPHLPAGVTDRFAQMVAAVKGENVSKVTDPETGEPMVVYHGTDAPLFYTFNVPAFFTNDYELALERAKTRQRGQERVDAFFLNIKEGDGSKTEIYLDDDATQFIVYRRNQIKSATGNTGAFSRENNDIRYSIASQIIGDSGRAFTPEQRQMFKNVGRDAPKETTISRIKTWANKRWVQGIFDQFDPIKRLSGAAYALARLSKGSAGAFEAFLKYGKLSLKEGVYDADRSGGALDTVFKPLGKESTDFLYWIAGNRAERLAKEGRENLFTPDDIKAAKSLNQGNLDFDYRMSDGRTTRSREEAYKDSLKKFNAFNKNVLDMAEQSGLIDGKSRHLWEHDFYVPFYRVAEETGDVRGLAIGQGLARQQAFHKLKGGGEALNDLLTNTLTNWAHLIDASAKNRAAVATLKAAEKLGAARPATFADKQNVWAMEHGQKVEYVVDDPALLTALSALDFSGLRGPAMDALSATKRWLTIGVTVSPFFKVRNLIRDSVQAIGTGSGMSYNPAKNLSEGFKLTNRKTPEQAYVSALAGGGLIRFGTMLEGNDASRVRRLIDHGVDPSTILDTPGKVKAFYQKWLEPAVSVYEELGQRGEEINRMALYDQLIKQGKGHAEASLMARDLMDFSMQGSFTTIRFLTQVVPFMNARLQGMYKLGRAAKEDPARFAIVTGAVALMSLSLLAAYGDDDDWKRREDWDRDNYWWFKFGGEAFRIPKPFEIGAIATLAERGAEWMFDDEMNGERFRAAVVRVLGDQLSMNPVPQLVKPIIDIYSNKDSFTGRYIESQGMENLQAEYRYRGSTSMAARGISSAVGGALSPVQIDHLVRGYFSWLGAFAVGTADMAVRSVSDEPSRPASDTWKTLTGGMAQSLEGAPSRYVTRMYEQAKVIEEAYGTWRQLQKEGRSEQAAQYFDANQETISRYRGIERAKRVNSRINNQIRNIERSHLLSPEEKRERINQLRRQSERLAREAA